MSEFDAIPSGLRVLVVDDDILCLKIVGQMLRQCNYTVKTAENGKEALAKLRDKTVQIDLVLSDVYMPDMDGFKLLETIGLELDLPVIMMSSNGETPVVLRGVTHGAVDFLIKPVRIEELRNVWQHVVRRRKDLVQTSKEGSGEEEVVDGNRVDKKRKETGQRDGEDHTSTKKPRVVWSVEMHQQFVNAVNSLGIDKAVPKRILDLMNVEGLTRENVASHLQKYRLYLKRVAGVQVQPSGRGKAGHSPSMESQQTYTPMLMPQPMGRAPPGPGIPMASESLPEQELKMQLQMQQLRHQHAAVGAQPVYVKQEGLSGPGHMQPMMMVPSHYGNGAGIPNGLAAPDFGSVAPAMPSVSNLDNSGAAAGPSSTLMPMHSGSYDPSSLAGHSDLQAYGGEGSPALVYPDAMLPPPAPMTPMGLAPDSLGVTNGLEGGHHELGAAEGLANGHTDQDMENFINIFLEPNE